VRRWGKGLGGKERGLADGVGEVEREGGAGADVCGGGGRGRVSVGHPGRAQRHARHHVPMTLNIDPPASRTQPCHTISTPATLLHGTSPPHSPGITTPGASSAAPSSSALASAGVASAAHTLGHSAPCVWPRATLITRAGELYLTTDFPSELTAATTRRGGGRGAAAGVAPWEGAADIASGEGGGSGRTV